MQLIHALTAGIKGAENGTVDIFKRGTSTYATYYTDFEGTTAVTPTAAVSLDSNGRLEAYVNEVVDCRCKNSSGSVVVTFTEGEASSAVEVRSQSFTGTHYVTAASAAGNPTDLQAALNLWKDNAGDVDWKVEGATPTQLYNQTYTKAENVKRHGALGDGSSDDSTAVAAAISALSSGGVVFFPPGTYKITSALSVPQNVSLVGAGAECTAISMDHESNKIITTTGTATHYFTVIEGLRIVMGQANSSAHIDIATAVNLLVRNCTIGDSSFSDGDLISDASVAATLICENCDFVMGSTTSRGINMTSTTGRSIISRCTFRPLSSASNPCVRANDCHVLGCTFNPSGTGLGTADLLQTDGNAVVVGNRFVESTGTINAIKISSIGAADEFFENDNTFGASLTAYSYTATDGQRIVLGSRVGRTTEVTDDTAAVTLAADQYESIVLNRTADQAQVISANRAPPGSKFILMIRRIQAGAFTQPTFATHFRTSGAVAVPDLSADMRIFVAEEFAAAPAGSLEWTQINTKIDVTV